MTEIPQEVLQDYQNRTVIDVTNLKWHDAEHTVLDADVLFQELESMGPVPFSTSADSDTRHGLEVWTKALEGDYGAITEFVPPSLEEIRSRMAPLLKWRFEAVVDMNGLRTAIDDALETLPEPDRTVAKSKRQYVAEFHRDDPLFLQLGSALSLSQEQIDDLWQVGLSL